MISNNKFFIVSLLLILLNTKSVSGQQAAPSELTKLLLDLQSKYQENKDLSMRVVYTYADEHHPDVVLDSSVASIDIDSNSYHCLVDSTDIYANDSFTVVLFKEEKIMYVSRTHLKSALYNPAIMLDSLMRMNKQLHAQIEETNAEKIIVLTFPEGSKYRKIELTLDKESGFLTGIDYLLKTQLLLDEGEKRLADSLTESYAILKARFIRTPRTHHLKNYSPEMFFVKQQDHIYPTAAFKDYQVMVGSSVL